MQTNTEGVNNFFEIENRKIGINYPVYFVADIGANHNGSLNKAKDLIFMAAEAGANAIKFQHFSANTIVSDYAFKLLKDNHSHQAKWKKNVFEVYQAASLNLDWTSELKNACEKSGVTFFSSPYSMELADFLDPYVPAYKIGSGDITWIEFIEHIAGKNKPYLLATGASNIDEVDKAVSACLKINNKLCLMQCNTNYTADSENLKFVNLNVLKMYARRFPNLILGLSDHTPGHLSVLGAVSLGSKIIEKHFTDNNQDDGPDHLFAMNPKSWKEMVLAVRDLEFALGSEEKKIEDNEIESSIVQRRAIRASRNLQAGEVLSYNDLIFLRPCPSNAIPPSELKNIIGKTLKNAISFEQEIQWKDFH